MMADPWKKFTHIVGIDVHTDACDVNGDGVVNITDVTTLIQMLLTGAPSASAYPAADMNGDGNINITDVTTLITQVMNN